MRDFVLEKQIVTHITKTLAHDAALLELFLLNCIFSQNIGTLLLGLFESK